MGLFMERQKALVLSNEMLSEGIYSLWLKVQDFSGVKPGQFVNLFSNDSSHVLPRPISICDADPTKEKIRLVYRTVGEGTKEFSELKEGQSVDLIGPLGNGYPLEIKEKNALLLGGGLGIPPMLYLLKEFPGNATAVLGYRDTTFLKDDFLSTGKEVYIATEDGSFGTKGNVIGAILENKLKCDVIFACGPKPMLSAVKKFAESRGIKLYVSMEERMACGVGVCLGCVVESTKVDSHSNVKNKRVCKDGPVFDAEDIVL